MTTPFVTQLRSRKSTIHLAAAGAATITIRVRGWEILDETASLADAGAIDGSILLLTFRRRRAVR